MHGLARGRRGRHRAAHKDPPVPDRNPPVSPRGPSTCAKVGGVRAVAIGSHGRSQYPHKGGQALLTSVLFPIYTPPPQIAESHRRPCRCEPDAGDVESERAENGASGPPDRTHETALVEGVTKDDAQEWTRPGAAQLVGGQVGCISHWARWPCWPRALACVTSGARSRRLLNRRRSRHRRAQRRRPRRRRLLPSRQNHSRSSRRSTANRLRVRS